MLLILCPASPGVQPRFRPSRRELNPILNLNLISPEFQHTQCLPGDPITLEWETNATMTRTLPILVWIYLTTALAGQNPVRHGVADLLPSNARIIETATVPVRTAKTRLLVLWMQAPRRVTSEWDSAADFVYGDHWLGPTFLSLVDPSASRLINTVTIRGNQESPDDNSAFAIPFFTYNGFYYVPHPDKDRKGKPLLMRLQDMTGEGVAGQFVLFDHVASGIAAGSVVGYSSSPIARCSTPWSVRRTGLVRSCSSGP